MSGKSCKFFNTGFCKFVETCRFKHAKENCVDKCDRTICDKRHPKPCKYGIKCKRGQSCAYRHQTTPKENFLAVGNESKIQIESFKKAFWELFEQTKEYQTKISALEEEIASIKSTLQNKVDRKDHSSKELNSEVKTKENGSKENAECKTNKVQSHGGEYKISEQMPMKKIFKCEQCHKSSNSKQDLTIHMKEAHTQINSPNGTTTQNTKREICWLKNCDQQPASMSHCTAYCNCC